MKIDITPVVEAAFVLLSAIITTFIIPWIMSKTSNERLKRLSALVSIAVEAAEQIYTRSGQGAEKKAYVMAYLESRGLTIDFETVDNLIESAVFNLPQKAAAATEIAGFAANNG